MAHFTSLIITTRSEDPALLEATVQGLLATTAQHAREIIVVDDASQEPVRLPGYPHVSVLRNPEPLGVSGSRRRGARAAAGSVLAFVDAHMSFAPGWLDAMLEHVDVGALLCTPWRDYHHKVVHAYGARLVWRHQRDWAKGHHPGLTYMPLTERPEGGVVEVPMIIGACYVMSRETYDLIGGSCPIFRGYGYDDVDLSLRAWLAGFGVACVTGARVGHFDRWGEAKPPYPSMWAETEHNLLVSVRSIFERDTAVAYEELLAPLPGGVERALDGTEVAPWRERVQRIRALGDAELLRRFAGDSPLDVRGRRARIRPGRDPVARLAATTLAEEAGAARALAGIQAPRARARRGLGRRAVRLDLDQLPRLPGEQPDGAYGAGVGFELFGARIGLLARDAELLRQAPLPLRAKPLPESEADVDLLYTLRAPLGRGGEYRLCQGDEQLLRAREIDTVWSRLARSLARRVPLLERGWLFIKAGVVAQGQRAVVLVGAPAGRQALQAALVASGGRHISNTYAVVDERGRIHGWPSSLSLRADGGLSLTLPPTSTSRPLRLGLVASVRLVPGATWRPRALTPGQAALGLLANAVVTTSARREAFSRLAGLPADLRGVEGTRGQGAMAVASELLERLAD